MKRGLLVVLVVSMIIISGCSRNDMAKPSATRTPVITEQPAVETPTPSPASKSIEEPLTVGDIVLFGSYEQDGDENDGAEPLEWLVIDEQDGELLLLSKYAIEVMNFAPAHGEGRWVTSPIRDWLNAAFYTDAFTKDEKEYISQTRHQNFYRVDMSNGQIREGKEQYDFGKQLFIDEDTQDYVFLLSEGEAIELSSDVLRCNPTKHALKNGADTTSTGF